MEQNNTIVQKGPITTTGGEIILYQPDSSIRLEVRMQEETVWLTQAQMTQLFQTTKQNVSLHIGNIFKEGELNKNSVVKDFLTTAADGKSYHTSYYNLDVIISVGYRVKNIRGTQFRQWANSVLKDYLLRGYAVNQRIERLEQRVTKTEEQIGFSSSTERFTTSAHPSRTWARSCSRSVGWGWRRKRFWQFERKGGGSAQRCASRGMTYRIRGKRGKRWAAEMMSLATERFPPPPIFSLSLIRRRTSFRRERSEWRNIVVARARRKEYSPSESPGEARAIWLAAAHR